jgi:hypothetical protein
MAAEKTPVPVYGPVPPVAVTVTLAGPPLQVESVEEKNEPVCDVSVVPPTMLL